MKTCTWCGRKYPDDAKVCALDQHPLAAPDGTVTPTPESQAADSESASPENERANRDIVSGGLWCVGGLAVTFLTYTAASRSGGTYFIAWGAVVFGGFQLVRGLLSRGLDSDGANRSSGPSYQRPDPEPHLEEAARLESVDRDQAIAKYEEIIELFPDTRASAEAARNIRILTARKE